jgi:Phosphotransferase enzyme family
MHAWHRPSVDELRSALVPALQKKFPRHGAVTILSRHPHIYTSSAPSEIVTCELASGTRIRVLCKYCGGNASHGHRAGTAGEALTYREVLMPLGVAKPAFFGSHLDPENGKTWLFLEYLEGVRLGHAENAELVAAAEWLGGFHARAEDRLGEGFKPLLQHYDRAYYRGWCRRTLLFSEPGHELYPWLKHACQLFEKAIEALERPPATVVHGEFYPLNILLVDGVITPIDWESARVGPGEIDLVSLSDKWEPEVIEECKDAYMRARWPAGAPDSFNPALEAAQFYWALRWLGDRPEWTLEHLDAYGPFLMFAIDRWSRA